MASKTKKSSIASGAKAGNQVDRLLELKRSIGGRSIRYSKSEVDKINKQIRKIRNPIYRLNAKERSIKGRGKSKRIADVISKRNAYRASIETKLTRLVEKRGIIRSIRDARKKISIERRILKQRLNDLKQKRIGLSTNSDKFKELYKQISSLQQYIDRIDDATGKMLKEERELYGEWDGDMSGFVSNTPQNPVGVWEASNILARDIGSKRYDLYVVDMVTYVESEEAEFAMDRLRYRLRENPIGTSPVVFIYYNYKKRIAIYSPDKLLDI